MTDPDEGVRLGGGLPPLQPLRPLGSLEDDEKALKKGRGRMAFGMVAALVALAGALVFAMAGDPNEAYAAFGRNLNGLDRTHYDAFWGCVFEGPMDASDNREMAAELHERAGRGGKAFGAYVRDSCLSKLDEYDTGLEALIVPEDLGEEVLALHEKVRAQRQSWAEYIAHLDALGEEGYDAEAARANVIAVTRAWHEYRRAYLDLNTAIGAHLES